MVVWMAYCVVDGFPSPDPIATDIPVAVAPLSVGADGALARVQKSCSVEESEVPTKFEAKDLK